MSTRKKVALILLVLLIFLGLSACGGVSNTMSERQKQEIRNRADDLVTNAQIRDAADSACCGAGCDSPKCGDE